MRSNPHLQQSDTIVGKAAEGLGLIVLSYFKELMKYEGILSQIHAQALISAH